MAQMWIMTQKKRVGIVTYHFRDFVKFFKRHDVHQWQIGLEHGEGGLEHYQMRFTLGDKNDFDVMKRAFPTCHLEQAEKWSNYETKEGHYITSRDNTERLKIRFGKPTEKQISVIKNVMKQKDREITSWIDVKGGHGKTWLCHYLFETRKGFYVPPTLSAQRMIEHIADGYEEEPIIVIDIPRACKWTDDLYIALESIKDGLITDTRYNSRIKSIRGAKVLVMANSCPNVKKLTNDRWVNEKGEKVVKGGGDQS